MTKPFDIVLWGATGFTGQLTAKYLARHAPDSLRWAIAGRNQAKLTAVRQSLTAINPTLADLPILLGDSHDRAALDAIVAQTRVVCTTVGPFAKYGTPLVAACMAQGVDYCDITGETPWIRANIDTFHEQAEQTDARIVHCCGFDSIPSDLGVLMVQEFAMAEYGRYCQTIQHTITHAKGGFSGGTFASLLDVLQQAGQDRKAAKMMANPYSLVPGHKHDWSEADQMTAVYDPDFKWWTAPFVMAAINTRIVRRSHALQDFRYGSDFRYSENMRMGSRLMASTFSGGFKLLVKTAAFSPVRRLLDAVLPSPSEGPSVEQMENGFFRTQLLGKIPAQNGQPEIWVKGKTGGKHDPGYAETAKMLSQSALCLAFDDLPPRGGILTPAAALGLPLLARLRAADMIFTAEKWGE